MGARVWQEKKRLGEKSYVVVKCPFKLIYSNAKSKDQRYQLVRQETNHIHRVDFWKKIQVNLEKNRVFLSLELFLIMNLYIIGPWNVKILTKTFNIQ